MSPARFLHPILTLPLLLTSLVSAQEPRVQEPSTSAPRLLLLVRQEVQYGKQGVRQKLEVNMARASNRLNVPNDWIDLESITGSPQVLFFDPFDSYDHLEQSFNEWNKIYAAHSDLAKMQEEINGLLTSERTYVAQRRDDLSYRLENIDLSEARFMRVVELHYSPGHESDFVQTFRILNNAYEKANTDTPWVVYQMTMGTANPGFLIFIPMGSLKQNDAVLPWTEGFLELEGEDDAQQLQQIARDTFASAESNLYAISPEMSHVSRKSAANSDNPAKSKPSAATKSQSNSDNDSMK